MKINYYISSLVLGLWLSFSDTESKAMELQTPPLAGSASQDIEKLYEILEEYGDFSPSPEYKYFGDKILELLQTSPHVDPEETQVIKEQYQSLGEDITLMNITWMSIQAAMALTPKEKRNMPAEDLSGDIPAFIRQLNEIRGSKELWKHSLSEAQQESLRLMMLLSLNNYMCLMPYIQNSKSQNTFFKEDFLKGFAGRDIYGEYYQVFLYSVATGKGAVHGGIYQTPIEIVIHDLAHLRQQVGSSTHRNFKPNSRLYGELVHQLLCAAQTANFEKQERKQIITILFYTIHEVLESIEERFARYTKIEINSKNEKDLFELYLQRIEDLLKDCERDMQNEESTFSLTHIEKRRLANPARYQILKQFHRDRAYDLIKDGFLTKEQVLIPGKEVLGLSYNLQPVHDVLSEMIHWMRQELQKDGRLYTALKAQLVKN
ncbi:hypothetical protein [Candidatus Odyssella thessalonicensis]|uniref:hypothetical protein n=1 Tax=Candidatus Odyssella thessalonicensis TaxID=84647 RepID=UPI000225ABC7|nr:hypothetical protein [Candidatus Odyssella thessalonicensis]